MAMFGNMPAGVRLDPWPVAANPVATQDSPEVAHLREELRKSVPQMVVVLETLAKLRYAQTVVCENVNRQEGGEKGSGVLPSPFSFSCPSCPCNA